MTRKLAILALVLLAGCHRPRADQPVPGADADAQANTAAKTLADVQAANDAAQGPAPDVAPVSHRADPALKPAAAAPADETQPVDNAATLPAESNQVQQ